MGYGARELLYAEPFANALVADPRFRSWVIGQTIFSSFADARLMNREMQSRRNARYWWRSHFTEACRCEGCSGQETDLLAIFEASSGFRFAIHVEVKHPGDRFKYEGRQASSYALRAECWAGAPPTKVVRHDKATTALLCSQEKLEEYAEHLPHFATIYTFEQIGKSFPNVVPAL